MRAVDIREWYLYRIKDLLKPFGVKLPKGEYWR